MDYIDRLLFRVTEAGSIIRPRRRSRFEPLPPMESELPELMESESYTPFTEIDDGPEERRFDEELPSRPRPETQLLLDTGQEADDAMGQRIYSQPESKAFTGNRKGKTSTTDVPDTDPTLHPRRQNKPSKQPKDASALTEAQQYNPILPDSQKDNPILPDPQKDNPIPSDPQKYDPMLSDSQADSSKLTVKHQPASPLSSTGVSQQKSGPRQLQSMDSPERPSLSYAPDRSSRPGGEKQEERRQRIEVQVPVEKTSRSARDRAATPAPVSENKAKAQDQQAMPGSLETERRIPQYIARAESSDQPRKGPTLGRGLESPGPSQNKGKVSPQPSPAETTININIGRIEVRATQVPTQRPKSRTTSAPMSLDEYLNKRNKVGK